MDELLIRKHLAMLEQRVANLEAYLVAKGHLVPEKPDERGYVAPREPQSPEPRTAEPPLMAEPQTVLTIADEIPLASVTVEHVAPVSPLPPSVPHTPLAYQPPPPKTGAAAPPRVGI
jgi:hypothetical protein